MAVHQYNSWGRTRGPKNIAGPPGTAIEVMAEGDEPDGITGSDGGYATENQRYLHVTVEPGDGAPGEDIEIWMYSHATAVWSIFTTINCDAITQNTTYVIEIYGVDRVAFVRDADVWGDEPTVYAACSTF
tara:strand:+ start:1473 stop:1862 length:390 start_codon:yes stop_codon:yes gene_type:complete